MDARCRGQLQALLTGLEAQNNRGFIDVRKIEDNMAQFLKKLKSYMASAALITEQLKSSHDENTTLNETIAALKIELSEAKEISVSQQTEINKYKILDGVVNELKEELKKAQDSIQTYKLDIEQFEERCEHLNKRISDLNIRISDKDGQIEKLNEKVKLGAENEKIVEDELKAERDKSQSLNKQIETLKTEHRDEKEKYQLEMNEKLIKAQTRLAQQSATSSDPSAGGMDYRELYRRKIAIIESKHQKEMNEMRKTISRLQTQRS